ncbi:MAG: mechanosensitive ion channel domain-containing protein [Desulfobulbales bacterium]
MKKIKFIPWTLFYLGLLFISLIIFSSICSQVFAEDGQGQYQKSELLISKAAPVIVDGKELFQVGGITSYPAKVRASEIASQIKALAAKRSFDPTNLQVIKEGSATIIKADNLEVLALVEVDATREGVALDVLVDSAKTKITKAIYQYRIDRAPRTLIINSGYALAATVVTALLIWGILRLFSWFNTMSQQKIKARIEQLESKSHNIIQADQISDIIDGLLKTAKVLSMLVVIYFYLNLVLGLYPWTRLFALYLFSITVEPLRIIGMGLLTSLPNIFFLIIFFFIVRYVLKVTRLFFSGISRGSIRMGSFDREWGMPTYKIVRLLIISFALVVAYPYIPGSSSGAFKGVSIFLGVIFSLGSSSVLTNIIAGYTITYQRAFKIGDRVRINDVTGDVTARSVLETRLRSLKNEEIVIPNSTVLNNNVINYSAEANTNGIILHTTVGIGYEVPWRQVETMLLLAAERTKGIKTEPKPFILQQSLGDFAINYELNAYCGDAKQMAKFYTDLHRNILDVFNEHNVQIMTPNYVQDTEEPKVVPEDQWYTEPAQKSQEDSGTE